MVLKGGADPMIFMVLMLFPEEQSQAKVLRRCFLTV